MAKRTWLFAVRFDCREEAPLTTSSASPPRLSWVSAPFTQRSMSGLPDNFKRSIRHIKAIRQNIAPIKYEKCMDDLHDSFYFRLDFMGFISCYLCVCVLCINCLQRGVCVCVCASQRPLQIHSLFIQYVSEVTIGQALFYSICSYLCFMDNHDPRTSSSPSIDRGIEREY